MLFDQPAAGNPIDNGTVVGRPVLRIDGPLKVSGAARYAFERNDAVTNPAYGFVLGAGVAKGRVRAIDAAATRAAPGVLAVVTTLDHAPLSRADLSAAMLFGGDMIEHYHQAIAVVVAETFEQARAASRLLKVDYEREDGRFVLAAEAGNAKPAPDRENGGPDAPDVDRVGDFEAAFQQAAVTIDSTYTTPHESHAQMEPHATVAAWEGDRLTVWTANQMVNWAIRDLPRALSMGQDKVRVVSPYIGGGFGAKLFIRSDVVLAALAAKAAGRPVKLALQRALIFNNGTHRSATIQRVRLAARADGVLTGISHRGLSGNLPLGGAEMATSQTKILYAAPNREIGMTLAAMDLPESNFMRAPGEAPGLMALEVAMDEMAEKLGMDPVEFRVLNDTRVDPHNPSRPFSERHLVECLRTGAARFGWSARRSRPGERREGRWLVGMGVASGIRNAIAMRSGARVRLEASGGLIVETDMTDIGTGTYTIVAQTAAEMLGLTAAEVEVRLGDSNFPRAAGSGGQWGAANATSGVFAACVALRDAIADRLGFPRDRCEFIGGTVRSGNEVVPLQEAARGGGLTGEDSIEFGDLEKRYQQSTFAAQFAEVGVDAFTGEVRLRRMLCVCDVGRILNPATARSQVIGGMTMGLGAALIEELAVDPRRGFFVNHDMAGYEVPVHADIPHLDVVLLDHPDALASPMKAKGIGELGLCGAAPAIANAVYNATGLRVRDYPITLEKHLHALPALALL
ncbi:xanthine dehydrogenase family protein molybdopterin-binding subunit [Roseomonas nepalensis]|uniref:Xanthine dehydrogenase family protein molybdopterin-binding subunit n=1 Tax=Muricoccus nepalensis TaxID=1854500 RepID=A0A502GEE5_9PROT|nr:aldehyde oxidoreductase molybdenum-binding subunit PaoC [Roseomonas nepalensis]TPG59650.1 xanthine dehydrogenase family protein molybdopterin-binding subunit [Roseomonas nepalensis]